LTQLFVLTERQLAKVKQVFSLRIFFLGSHRHGEPAQRTTLRMNQGIGNSFSQISRDFSIINSIRHCLIKPGGN